MSEQRSNGLGGESRPRITLTASGSTTIPLRPKPRFRSGRLLLLPALVLAFCGLGAVLVATPTRDKLAQVLWYLTDSEPPQLSISIPPGPARGIVTATVAVTEEGPYILDSLLLDGTPLTPTQQVTIDTSALSDGEHTLEAEARDLSRQRNEARIAAHFRTDNTPPTVSVGLQPPIVGQGSVLIVRLASSKPVTIVASYDGAALPLVGADGIDSSAPATHFCGLAECWSPLAFAADAKPLTHTVAFQATDSAGNTSRITATFRVTATNFVIEDITLPPDRAGLSNSADEAKRLDAAFATFSARPLWQGPFSGPAPGEVTAPFGEARSYNGGPVASHHGGVDLAAEPGSPVGAVAAGRVVLADTFPVQGNAVLIDHGLGLVSAYFHLSAMTIKAGDLITRGQSIGLVGNTGLSTGPHLHWEMRLRGTPVDPWFWTRQAIP